LINLTNVVSLANLFCHRYGVGTMAAEEELDVAASLPAQNLGLDADRINILLERFIEAYSKDQALFS